MHAPGTKEQWREWTDAHWPLCWRPPEATKPSDLEPLSESECAAMHAGMNAAYTAAIGAPVGGNWTNSAVMVDPSTAEVQQAIPAISSYRKVLHYTALVERHRVNY